MHNQFLGILQDHCREMWGMDLHAPDGLGYSHPSKADEVADPEKMQDGLWYLLHGTEVQLTKDVTRPVLWNLCAERNLRRAGTKRQMIKELAKWREREGFPIPSNELALHIRKKQLHKLGKPSTVQKAHQSGPSTARLAALATQAPAERQIPAELLPHRDMWQRAERAYEQGRDASYFSRLRKPVLQYMCNRRLLSPLGTISDLANRLVMDRYSLQRPDSANIRGRGAITGPRAIPQENTAPRDNRLDMQQDAIVEQGFAPGPPIEEGAVNLENVEEASPRKASKKTKVLGRDTLAAIHLDAEKMELPSWLSRAPAQFGSKATGKLSADQWRTVCTIHLPITLIRLWSLGSDDPGDVRRKQMLDNYMDLVTAVTIAGMVVMTEEHIKLYEEAILRYLRTIKELYPEASIKPNHYLAIHLAVFMHLFGPVHSWRFFNYLLQCINTNMRIGDLELTFMNCICQASNLRPILADPELQDAINDVINAYNDIVQEDGPGTRVVDSMRLIGAMLPKQEQAAPQDIKGSEIIRLSNDLYNALLKFLAEESGRDSYVNMLARTKWHDQYFLPRKAVSLKKLSLGGVTYKPHRESLRDSRILVRMSTLASSVAIRPPSAPLFPPADLHAVRIEELIYYERPASSGTIQEQFVVVRCLQHLTAEHASLDPYRKYGFSGGFICYDRFLDSVDIIRTASIVCHFVHTSNITIPGVESSCIHVLPLDRILQLISTANDSEEASAADDMMDVGPE
ncbi:hypothetical protein NM688_g5358 [Phlebia brevispora]|uniref:Uncharacterized protein n=1 Tax=Phlebia brevispora TaxID=194682 RepID=A0ACC1SWS5_9APHY|nr:hypothetical protein NM688_g5358 [Phlebia brevispora]